MKGPLRPRPVPALVLAGVLALTVPASSCGGPHSGSPDAPSPPDTASPDASGEPSAPTVRPGAPGEPTRTIDPATATEGHPPYTEADVRFMQGMIPHHEQALVMTALVRENTDNPDMHALALRMEISQRDEIGLMERWLAARGESRTGGMEGMLMPGMLTAEQMDELREARGEAFDRLWLRYMIMHHEGALEMVADLFGSTGAGQGSEIFQFATHVDADQRAEIARMRQMLGG